MNIYKAIDKIKHLLEKQTIFTAAQYIELNTNISELFQEYIRNNIITGTTGRGLYLMRWDMIFGITGRLLS